MLHRESLDIIALPASLELTTQLPATLRVGVRELCEFSAGSGDLDVRFGMSPNAREGIAGHDTVTSRRGGDYQKKVSLKGRYEALSVAGRANRPLTEFAEPLLCPQGIACSVSWMQLDFNVRLSKKLARCCYADGKTDGMDDFARYAATVQQNLMQYDDVHVLVRVDN